MINMPKSVTADVVQEYSCSSLIDLEQSELFTLPVLVPSTIQVLVTCSHIDTRYELIP